MLLGQKLKDIVDFSLEKLKYFNQLVLQNNGGERAYKY